MAEKQVVEETGGVAANRPTGPEVEVQGTAQDLIDNAPEPSSDGKIYRVMYPNDHFVMEGMPVVNQSGVVLTDAQAEELLPVAEASGVKIVEVTE